MGSLLCALASYLDAKASDGQWLLRIEDIDPPREIDGASEAIIDTLDHHKLCWDGDIVWQSKRSKAYQNTLSFLLEHGLAYHCTCTRKRLSSLGHVYDNACRDKNIDGSTPSAIRLNTEKCLARIKAESQRMQFTDGIQGTVIEDFGKNGDFVIHRKDGLFAYQLAVVVDDIAQEITHIVRGSDLLETTLKQVLLTQTLDKSAPLYVHIPVLNHVNGLKLSKQNHAPAIENTKASHNLLRCLRCLNQSPPLTLVNASPQTIVDWAVEHWNSTNIPKHLTITEQ